MTYLFLEQTVEFLFAVLDAQPIRGINDPDQRIRLFKVISPVRPQRLLAADIPYKHRG